MGDFCLNGMQHDELFISDGEVFMDTLMEFDGYSTLTNLMIWSRMQ